MPLKHIFAEDFVTCGRLGKTRGNEGHLKAYFDISAPVPENGDFLFLRIQGLPVPYRIRDIMDKGELALCFSGVDTPEKASALVNAEILQAQIQEDTDRSEFTKELVGFSLWNEQQHIGSVAELREYPGQWMLIVASLDGEKLLVPLVQDWVESVDLDNQEIHMTIPDGLLS